MKGKKRGAKPFQNPHGGITMNKIAKIAAALQNVTGASFMGISTETPVTLKGGKKNPLQGRVTKRMEGGNVIIFTNTHSNGYENMVKRRLLKEGMAAENFTLGKRVWGERLKDAPFVFHKGAMYVEVIFNQSPSNVTYFVDGKETPKEEIIGLPDKSEGEQGGLSDKVIIRTYNAENIRSIRIDGKEFTF